MRCRHAATSAATDRCGETNAIFSWSDRRPFWTIGYLTSRSLLHTILGDFLCTLTSARQRSNGRNLPPARATNCYGFAPREPTDTGRDRSKLGELSQFTAEDGRADRQIARRKITYGATRDLKVRRIDPEGLPLAGRDLRRDLVIHAGGHRRTLVTRPWYDVDSRRLIDN